MKCDIHAYNMLYNSVRFCIFKRPAVHCYCCFTLGYTKKHTYFHISFSNENGLGNLIALPLLHFSQNSIATLQYFNKLESYWNIAIYCNNSINCNLLQYDAIKQRSVFNYSELPYTSIKISWSFFFWSDIWSPRKRDFA